VRIKHNMILLVIIACLLIAIVGITNWPADRTQEVNVNNEQTPNFSEANNIEIIWDVSDSMWGKVDNERKYLRAKKALVDIINSIPTNVNIGLRTIGNQKGSNGSTKLVVNITKNNKQNLLDNIESLRPTGKSPIGKAMLEASDDLSNLEGNKHILLVTDGKDTGKVMPSKLANQIYDKGIRVHVLQVGSNENVINLKLQSIAQLGGGKYFTYSEKDKVVPTMNLIE